LRIDLQSNVENAFLCRERFSNHLDPTLKKTPFDDAEDVLLTKLQNKFGNRWVLISKYMQGRSENEIKNHWNSVAFRKKRYTLINSGINLSIIILDEEDGSSSSTEGMVPPPTLITTIPDISEFPTTSKGMGILTGGGFSLNPFGTSAHTYETTCMSSPNANPYSNSNSNSNSISHLKTSAPSKVSTSYGSSSSGDISSSSFAYGGSKLTSDDSVSISETSIEGGKETESGKSGNWTSKVGAWLGNTFGFGKSVKGASSSQQNLFNQSKGQTMSSMSSSKPFPPLSLPGCLDGNSNHSKSKQDIATSIVAASAAAKAAGASTEDMYLIGIAESYLKTTSESTTSKYDGEFGNPNQPPNFMLSHSKSQDNVFYNIYDSMDANGMESIPFESSLSFSSFSTNLSNISLSDSFSLASVERRSTSCDPCETPTPSDFTDASSSVQRDLESPAILSENEKSKPIDLHNFTPGSSRGKITPLGPPICPIPRPSRAASGTGAEPSDRDRGSVGESNRLDPIPLIRQQAITGACSSIIPLDCGPNKGNVGMTSLDLAFTGNGGGQKGVRLEIGAMDIANGYGESQLPLIRTDAVVYTDRSRSQSLSPLMF